MAFNFDETQIGGQNIHTLRDEIGDTVEFNMVFSDARLETYLSNYGSVEASVIPVLRRMIAQLSQQAADVSTAGHSEARSQRLKALRDLLTDAMNNERYSDPERPSAGRGSVVRRGFGLRNGRGGTEYLP